jgi:hypothetical protein
LTDAEAPSWLDPATVPIVAVGTLNGSKPQASVVGPLLAGEFDVQHGVGPVPPGLARVLVPAFT